MLPTSPLYVSSSVTVDKRTNARTDVTQGSESQNLRSDDIPPLRPLPSATKLALMAATSERIKSLLNVRWSERLFEQCTGDNLCQ